MSDACKSCASSATCSPKEKETCTGPSDAGLKNRLSKIKHKIVVMSGKGGVGKSTVAVNIAVSLSLAGKKVGLLDVDVHGPSVPRLLSLKGTVPHVEEDFIEPVPWSKNLWVMSMGLLIPDEAEAVVWRGPVKIGVIRQFMENVAWGELDYLVIDCPPGTGDEPLTVMQLLAPEAKAVVVTTPQGLAIDDVRRSITFCRHVNADVLGLIENMSGFTCPDCGKTYEFARTGPGQRLAEEMQIPFLGRIPFDPEMSRSGDEGFAYMKVYPDTATAKAVNAIIAPLLALG